MSTTNISKTLLDFLKGSNQGTPQGNSSPGQAYQEEREDIRLESYEKERLLSPRELHKWKKSLFSVYVGRLPTDVTVRELVQFFSQVGVPKDAFVLPPEGNKSHTFGFLRYGTVEEARKAVACMNGRILGNRHLLVEISAETRAILNSKEEDDVCDAQDRLIRKEYPTFRRPTLPGNEEEFVQSKLLQSIAKLKSDQVSVVNAGYKDSEESNGPSFLDQLEEILKKVIREVPDETTAKSTADEGPICTIRLADMRQIPTETPNAQSIWSSPPVQNVGNRLPVDSEHSYPGSACSKMRGDVQQDSPVTPISPEGQGSPPVNGEKHSPINNVYSFGKPCHPGYVGLDMRQNMLQHSPETLKTNSSLGAPPVNGENHSLINTVHPHRKPADNSIANLGSVGMREDMQQNSPKVPQSIQSPCSPPMNGEKHSLVNSNHSPGRPSNDIAFLTKSMGLNNGFPEPQSKPYETAPVETRSLKTDGHYTTKATLPGDDLPMQELTISDGQNNSKKGSSLDPYVLSKMRDIPCQDVRQVQSEKRPCKISPTATQVSLMSYTDTALDAAALTPLSSKGNELSSMKILDAQRQICSSAAKDNIGIHGHIEHPSLSFRERISNILDEKSGNTPQVVTTFPGIMQGSTQRTQHSHSGEVTGMEERVIGVSPKDEERGNADTRMPARAPKSDGRKPCKYATNKEEDMEEISLQQAPMFGQNQLKEQTPLQDRQKQPPLEQEQSPCQDRQQQSPLQGKQEQPPLEQEQSPRQDRQQQSPLQGKQEQSPLEQEQPSFQDQMLLEDGQPKMPLQDKQGQTSSQGHRQQISLQDQQKQPPFEQKHPPFEAHYQMSFDDRQQQLASRDKQALQKQMPLQEWEPVVHGQKEQTLPLQDQQVQPPLQQQQLLLKQRSVHELQLKLGVILKENGRLHSALPKHYKDKRTSGMYPDKEMSNLEESIHNYEVKYQREIEITAARNAEHELLYEREKLSAAFDTNLQKELDLELQMEVLKNEIKLANMANQLLIFYQKRNDMQ